VLSFKQFIRKKRLAAKKQAEKEIDHSPVAPTPPPDESSYTPSHDEFGAFQNVVGEPK
jgi:hypothetical protein